MPFDDGDLLRAGDSPIHGRGVFTRVAAPRGAVLEAGAVVPYPIADGCGSPVLGCYSYRFDERTRCLALGLVTLCNHSPDANASMDIDTDAFTYRLVARQALSAGAEVFVDYGEAAPGAS
ncbi:MAG: SET domain-containing protein-lysine N-methyltransferase [Acidimicrobiales bacterium]